MDLKPGGPGQQPVSQPSRPAVLLTAPAQPPEQLLYARLLDASARLGLLVMVLSMASLALGLGVLLQPPHVPLQDLPQLWGQPVDRYLALTQTPRGWAWLGLARHADMAGLLGVAILASCSVLALLALVPLYLRRGDKVFAGLCLVQAAVIVLAASGWVGGGH